MLKKIALLHDRVVVYASGLSIMAAAPEYVSNQSYNTAWAAINVGQTV